MPGGMVSSVERLAVLVSNTTTALSEDDELLGPRQLDYVRFWLKCFPLPCALTPEERGYRLQKLLTWRGIPPTPPIQGCNPSGLSLTDKFRWKRNF